MDTFSGALPQNAASAGEAIPDLLVEVIGSQLVQALDAWEQRQDVGELRRLPLDVLRDPG